MLGLGTPIKLRTPEAAFDEIRQHVAGYDLSQASLLGGGAEVATASVQSCRKFVRRAGRRGLFISRFSVYKRHPGSLLFQAQFDERGERRTVEFAQDSSTSTQSWWYR